MKTMRNKGAKGDGSILGIRDLSRRLARAGGFVGTPMMAALLACCNAPPNTDRQASALGESRCANAPADAVWDGQIPEGGGDSPVRYSNPRCYKADVVTITNWASPFVDMKISAKAASVFEQYDYTQTTCEQLWLSAIVYENTLSPYQSELSVMRRTATGQWVSDGSFSYCNLPSVTFGGYTWRTDTSDIDTFYAGQTYTIAASYRDGTGATKQMHWESNPPRCGTVGLPCCNNLSANACYDDTGAQICAASTNTVATPGTGSSGLPFIAGGAPQETLVGPQNTCQPCGNLGQLACLNSSGHWCGNGLVALDQAGAPWSCVACGGSGEPCCITSQNTMEPCESGLACTPGASLNLHGTCAPVVPTSTPTPTPTPMPTWDPQCGNQYHQCCPQASGQAPCKLAQTCTPHQVCDNLGPQQDDCVVSATAVIDTCEGGNNILPGTTITGCGTTQEAAQNSALIGFGYNNICLNNEPGSGCCSYHFE